MTTVECPRIAWRADSDPPASSHLHQRNQVFRTTQCQQNGTVGRHIQSEHQVGPGEAGSIGTDPGPGIAPEYQSEIFEKFIQAPGGPRSGAGLGLAICKEIVERMGGEISVESEPGRGSTFRFSVPIAEAPGQLSLPWDTTWKSIP